jgi:hypothetical protein
LTFYLIFAKIGLMPLLKVTQDEVFRYVAEPVCFEERWQCSLRQVTTQELDEVQRLQFEAKKLEALLKTLYEREEYEHLPTDPYEDHDYCTVCRECITCNLRPCRDGGPHAL